ncbi:MAG: glycosyltransferase family 4 protein [Thermoplasmata archaeon]|nr:glycosyltransferase family 4 protein [Thermoplasmata archaeon]
MRICMVTSEFPPKWGGVGNGVYFQSKVFAERGYKIDVITRKQLGGKKCLDVHPNVNVIEVDWLKLPMFFTTSFGDHAVREIMERGNDYDVVHVHSNMTLLRRKHYANISSPIVSTLHGTWRGERQELKLSYINPTSLQSINDLSILLISPFFDKYEDYAIELSNAVIVESISEEEAVRRRGVENIYGRMYRVPAGVDINSFKPQNYDEGVFEKYGIEEGLRLLTVTRLAGRKGMDLLLRSFSMVRKEMENVALVIVGEGPQERALKRLARRLRIENSVHFIGSVPFEDLKKLYATSDLFVFHSRWEGQGLVILESMASGTPCVSSNVGGVREMIRQGVDGYYVEVGDIEGMAERVLELLKDEEKREEMARLGMKRIRSEWSWQRIAERYDVIYRDVLDDDIEVRRKAALNVA